MFDNMTFRLSCKVNNYHWGKVGKNSKVAVYAASNPSFKIDPYKNYSELWMGTHPNGPSALYEDPSMSLGTLIDQDPIEMLSAPVASKFHNQLPFLFKVLSINTALSIQAHPDKALATKLHQQFPHIYKDPNHKPEMAVALTVFEAMSGFRPLHEIADHLKNYPEFATLVGQDRADRFIEVASNPQPHSLDVQKRLLREVFTALMNSDPLLVKAQIERLLVRVP
ncbi:Mannose-6-phosphate isomerase, partial [Spiromyces aspiralis]